MYFLYLRSVALRKESVDRNKDLAGKASALLKSLSARRAWIEIGWIPETADDCQVALRKESVDRNGSSVLRPDRRVQSLSARRAWIEIRQSFCRSACYLSLSARRAWIEIM